MTENEIAIMQGMIDSLNGRLEINDAQMAEVKVVLEKYQKLLDEAQKKIEKCDEDCNKRIKDEVKKAKPGFFHELGKVVGCVILGGIIGALL